MDENELYMRGVIEGDKEAVRMLDKYWRSLFLGRFSRNFDELPIEDVEDAYQSVFSALIARRIVPRDDENIAKLFQVSMRNMLIEVLRKKKRSAKALGDYARERTHSRSGGIEPDETLDSLIERTPNLTPREIKVLRLAATGKSARSIGAHLDPPVTYATSWRIYDSAVSKIRIAHGLTSTKQERDSRRSEAIPRDRA